MVIAYGILAWNAPKLLQRCCRTTSRAEAKLLGATFCVVAPLYERITGYRWQRLIERDRRLRTEFIEAKERNSSREATNLLQRFEENRRELESIEIGYLGCMKVHESPIQGRLQLRE